MLRRTAGFFLLCAVPSTFAADPGGSGALVVTNLGQLRLETNPGERSLRPIQLNAVVLWDGPRRGRLAIKDDSGAEVVDVNLPDRSLEAGRRVRLEGMAHTDDDGIHIGAVAVVDNDGLHNTEDTKSGQIRLSSGLHPIRCLWFNGSVSAELVVEYEGPGIPRQRIPNDVLTSRVTSAGGSVTHRVTPGLKFRSYLGHWSRMPDFRGLQAVTAGSVANFDVSVRPREEGVGLEFEGEIEIPRDGLYTFWVSSDDGSKLFVGNSAVRLVQLEDGMLPDPIRLPESGLSTGGDSDPQKNTGEWVELEGVLRFIHADTRGGVELEVDAGTRKFRVDVQESSGSVPPFPGKVRVRGVRRSIRNTSGAAHGLRIVVPDLEHIRSIEPTDRPALEQASTSTASLTNLTDLHGLASAGERVAAPLRVEGTVLASSADGRLIALQNNGSAAFVELRSPGMLAKPGVIHPGDQIRLTGSCVVDHGRILAGNFPLADNNGTHGMRERSGAIHLKPGKHRIHLNWFNREGGSGLEVYYQGPDLPRMRVPESVLFHRAETPEGEPDRWAPGLEYRAFLGHWWMAPEFTRLVPVATGTAPDFLTSLAPRETLAGLEFSGYIQIDREGLYRFSTISDDGSLLYVDEEPGRLEVIGSGPVPTPVRIGVRQVLSRDWKDQWVQVEGTVTFSHSASGRLELEITSGAGSMRVEIGDAANVPERLLLNGRVRATGICRRTLTPDGQYVAGELLVPNIRQIQLLEPAGILWSTVPPRPIRAVLQNSGSGSNSITRVRGKGKLDPANGLLRVTDSTGEICVETGLVVPEDSSIPMEVLGFADVEKGQTILREGVFRRLTDFSDAAQEELPLLTTVEQVKGLGRVEAQRAYPVKIRGVITALLDPGFFFQDTTGALYVDVDSTRTADVPVIGDYWEVEGTTFAQFAPNVYALRATRLGRGTLPAPIRPSWDRLINGSLDTQYIEVEGVVTAIHEEGLTLLMRGGALRVGLEDAEYEELQRCENALVRLRGCLYPERIDDTEQLAVGNIYLYNPAVNIDEPAPADPFAIPLKTVGDLLQFDPHASLLQRIKVAGQVVHQRGGECFLMDGTNGLRFIASSDPPLVVGDMAEVVGFPQLGGPSPLLQYALVRKTGHAPLPAAETLTSESLLSPNRDATLVSIDARLLGIRASQGDTLLELQAGLRSFIARLQTNAGPVRPLVNGSLLRLTGVYAGQRSRMSAGPEIEAMELLLNSPLDVVTLEQAPWWTVRHTLTLVGGLTGILLLAGGWIRTLRSQVDQQTRDLKDEIEDRKRAEAEAERAREAADAANRAKSQFLAAMSHEIRTPMNGVIGMTNLLLESGLRSEQREFAETAKNSAEGLLTIINDILDFSKIEAGKLEFEVLDFDLVETVEATVELLAEKAQSKGLELNCGIDREAPRYLRGDPGRLRQVLLNLIGNAIKFTPQGEVTLEVKARPLESSKVELYFAIHDTGIGLTAAACANIFQPFVQADASTTRKYGGTGLGLGISRRLVEIMQGQISVNSEPGKGSTFWFTGVFEKGAGDTTLDNAASAVLKDRKVLVIEPNQTNRAILQQQIAAWTEIPVDTTGDAMQALAMLRAAAERGAPYQVAVLDSQVPGIPALELAHRIRNAQEISGTHLLLLTSMCDRKDPEKFSAAGIEMHLTKPVKTAQLQDSLTKLLGDDAAQAKVAPQPERQHLTETAQRLRILVAEDNSVNQKVALRLLQKLGCAADVAANGMEVLEAVRRQAYDVILMDCQMPEMDGYEATRRLRQRETERGDSRLWIVAMTANAMQGDRAACIGAGMDDYVSKPVRLANIIQSLNMASERLTPHPAEREAATVLSS